MLVKPTRNLARRPPSIVPVRGEVRAHKLRFDLKFRVHTRHVSPVRFNNDEGIPPTHLEQDSSIWQKVHVGPRLPEDVGGRAVTDPLWNGKIRLERWREGMYD